MTRRAHRRAPWGAVVAALAALAGAGAAGACAGRAPAPRADAPAAVLADRPADELARLDAAIAADLAALGLAPPDDGEVALRLAAGDLPLPLGAAAGSCPAPPPTGACAQACDLADAVCHNAGRICALADELGDAHAARRCAAGRASCERARTRCCAC